MERTVASEKHYREGEIFQTFSFMDKTFLLGLCGDFWYDENVKRANQIYKDVVLWPVYLNYTSETWNNLEKEEYATRAKLLGKRVLLFNSISLNPVALGVVMIIKTATLSKICQWKMTVSFMWKSE